NRAFGRGEPQRLGTIAQPAVLRHGYARHRRDSRRARAAIAVENCEGYRRIEADLGRRQYRLVLDLLRGACLIGFGGPRDRAGRGEDELGRVALRTARSGFEHPARTDRAYIIAARVVKLDSAARRWRHEGQ